jgi:hypothetical protein
MIFKAARRGHLQFGDKPASYMAFASSNKTGPQLIRCACRCACSIDKRP